MCKYGTFVLKELFIITLKILGECIINKCTDLSLKRSMSAHKITMPPTRGGMD